MTFALRLAVVSSLLAGVTLAQNDECSSPDPLAGQGTFPYNNASATTGSEGQFESNCFAFGTSGIANDIWFSWTPDDTGLAIIQTCGSTGDDTKIAAWDGGGCPEPGTSLACNDDACGLRSRIEFVVSEGTEYLLQVGNFPGTSGGAAELTISIDDTGFGPGTNFCRSTVNSTGSASVLTASGSDSISANDLVLTAVNLPTQPGMFIGSTSKAQIPYFDGFLCVGPGTLQRFGSINIPVGGSITQEVDLVTSARGGLMVSPGQAFYFQRWNLDPQAAATGANFSDGYQVVYTP